MSHVLILHLNYYNEVELVAGAVARGPALPVAHEPAACSSGSLSSRGNGGGRAVWPTPNAQWPMATANGQRPTANRQLRTANWRQTRRVTIVAVTLHANSSYVWQRLVERTRRGCTCSTLAKVLAARCARGHLGLLPGGWVFSRETMP